VKTLDARRSISYLLGAMTEAHKARWFVLNEVDAGPGFGKAIEDALDDGAPAEDVLATLIEAMVEDDDG